MAPPPSWKLIPAIGAAGLLTGASSIWLPQMPGNGKDIVLESLAGHGTLAGGAGASAQAGADRAVHPRRCGAVMNYPTFAEGHMVAALVVPAALTSAERAAIVMV
jgi:hypothetical protein